jgi:hypothetical protein
VEEIVRRLLCFAAALLVCALAAISAHAQSQATTAQITGVVTDTQGGVLPGATVTITSPQTGYTRTAVSNAEGFFSLSLVPPGTYDLGVELAPASPRPSAASSSPSARRSPRTPRCRSVR